jgi:hypothetical protein
MRQLFLLIILLLLSTPGCAKFKSGEQSGSDSDTRVLLHLNTGSGSTAYDVSGYGNNGTISNGTWVNGKFEYGVDFNGTTSVINCGSDSSIDNLFHNGATVLCWANLDTQGEVEGRLFDKGSHVFLATTDTSGDYVKLEFFHRWTGNYIWTQTSSAVVELNKWQMVAVTYDGTSSSNYPKFYVNGAYVNYSIIFDANVGSPFNESASSLGWGNDIGTNRTTDGTLDECTYIARILTAEEMEHIYRSQVTKLFDYIKIMHAFKLNTVVGII